MITFLTTLTDIFNIELLETCDPELNKVTKIWGKRNILVFGLPLKNPIMMKLLFHLVISIFLLDEYIKTKNAVGTCSLWELTCLKFAFLLQQAQSLLQCAKNMENNVCEWWKLLLTLVKTLIISAVHM